MRATWLLSVVVVIAGCQETVHCEGRRYGASCAQTLSGGSDSGMDAGADTGGDDGGGDAFVVDGGPCARCTADQICYEGDDAGTPESCVECAANADCTERDGGTADAGVLGTLICRDFSCVIGCDTDADCGGNFCRADRTCSNYPAYSGTEVVCAPCDSDGNCTAGSEFYCVPFTYQNGAFMHTGNYCLRASAACGAATAPLARPLTPTPLASVDGFVTSGGVCRPRTSCEALLDADDATTCSSDDDCGLATTADGVCNLARSACTVVCSDSTECPESLTSCVGTPLTCAP